MAWSSPAFFRTSAVLMGTHDRAVDHRVFIVGIGRQKGKDSLPDTSFGPTAEPLVNIDRLAEPFQ
jgi:hypothetical protein